MNYNSNYLTKKTENLDIVLPKNSFWQSSKKNPVNGKNSENTSQIGSQGQKPSFETKILFKRHFSLNFKTSVKNSRFKTTRFFAPFITWCNQKKILLQLDLLTAQSRKL